MIDLPYPDSLFDVVVDAACSHCIIGEDRRRFFSEAFRVLKHGGVFVLLSLCGDLAEEGMVRYFDPGSRCVVKDGVAGRYFGRPEEILQEMASAGFQSVSWEIMRDSANCDQEQLQAIAR